MSRALTKPPHFHELKVSPRLYFQIENDGGVIVTGEQLRCVFRLELPDKSVIEGGINHSGLLFGDRRFNAGVNTGRVTPLRWFSMEEIARGVLPPAQRRRAIKLPPGKKLKEKQDHPVGIASDTKTLMENYHGGDKEGRVLIQRLEGEIQRKDKAYAELRTKLTQLQQKHDAITAEVHVYRNGMAEAENAAKMEVEKLRNEYEGKKNTRRWQVEAVRSSTYEIEGMVAHSWEVEDAKGELKYLVVTRTPASTTSRVQEQWLAELQRQLDPEVGSSRVVYVSAPEGCSTTIMEILPDSTGEEDEEIDQF